MSDQRARLSGIRRGGVVINNLPTNMLAKLRIKEPDTYGLTGMCWIWTGCVNSKGYGCVQIGRTNGI